MDPRQGEKFELDRDVIGLTCVGAGEMFNAGQGGPQNQQLATQNFLRSCGFDYMVGCANLGESYELGRGIAKNEDAALAAYEKSCSDDLPISCYKFIRIVFWDANSQSNAPDNKQFASARRQSAIACDQQWVAQVSSCWYRGIFMIEARGGPADPAAALSAFRFTCDRSKEENGLNACYNVAVIHLSGPQELRNEAEAKRLLTAGCAANYEVSCYLLETIN
ncbi:MAG: hypothetical protein ABJK59_00315 [Erythrobacter sp.]|uniref:tetratricopeptide repeat protein n=1 Tax=Erythrobacter sp. TaxID=1042 RepID=UPI003299215B